MIRFDNMITNNDNAIRIMGTLMSDGNDFDNNKQGNETSIEKLYNVMNDNNDIDYEDRQIYCVSDSDDSDTTNNDNSNHNTEYNGDDSHNDYQRCEITLLIF